MATSKPITTLIILANLAMFSLVSTHAACPNLSPCLSIAKNLANAQPGSQTSSTCCKLIAGLVSTNADTCLCSTLQSTLLGNYLLANTPGLANGLFDGLPLLGGIFGGGGLGGILGGGGLGGILGGLPLVGPIVGIIGNLPIVGPVLSPILGGGSGGATPILGGGGVPPLVGGGGLPIQASLLTSVLNKEILVMANACGLDATKFTCTA